MKRELSMFSTVIFRKIACTALLCPILAGTAEALTGSGVSAPGFIETVAPVLVEVEPITSNSVELRFSEPLLSGELSLVAPSNYQIAGIGRGTLAQNPSTVNGSGPIVLGWQVGEMFGGETVRVGVTAVRDQLGNLGFQLETETIALGEAPEFINLEVSPAKARPGDVVSISFDATEALQDAPYVTINGVPAFETSKGLYNYIYVVPFEESAGPVTISITGFDLAGNLGFAVDSEALSILGPVTLPAPRWWLALLLLPISLWVLLARRKACVATLLALASAWPAIATPPEISNVTFVQRASDSGSTELLITYDLVSPNDPSDISVFLSKDGGTDNYPYEASLISGNVFNQTSGNGKTIIWAIGAEYPDETLPNARIKLVANDEKIEYTINYIANTGGSVRLDPPGGPGAPAPTVVQIGIAGTQCIPVTAIPDPGYRFKKWSDTIPGIFNDGPTREDLFIVSKDLTATFVLVFNVTYLAGPGGSIIGNTAQQVDSARDSTSVTAVPDTGLGYEFIRWSDGSTQNPRFDENVAGDITVTAEFAKKVYQIQYLALEENTLSTADEPGTFIGGGAIQSIIHGESTTQVEAVALPGWDFVGWEDGHPLAFRSETNVTDSKVYKALFRRKNYTITFDTDGNGLLRKGTTAALTAVVSQTVAYKKNGSPVTAVPNAGYRFLNWSDASPLATRSVINVQADLTATARFLRQYTLSYTAGPNGSISGNVNQTVDIGANGSVVTAVPNSGFRFTGWSDGNNSPTRTDTNVQDNLAVTANFIRQFSLSYTAGPNGSITGDTTQTVDIGTNGTSVTAVPDVSCIFTGWSDGNSNPTRTDINIQADLSVTANFVRQHTLTYSAGTGGRLQGNALQIVNAGTNAASITAIGRPGYAFVNWSDGNTNATRQELDVQADFTLSATFEESNVGDMIQIPAGSFTRGGGQYTVFLSAYQIGRYEVTNQQICDVFNWALDQNLIPIAGPEFEEIEDVLQINQPQCPVKVVNNRLQPKDSTGLPDNTSYSLAQHPAFVTMWTGAVFFCNFLSQMEGLTPVYDPITKQANFANNGYHLPTEAQWERAAAWDGVKSWTWGNTSDTSPSFAQINYGGNNPLGLVSVTGSSPVGWFDGINFNLNRNLATENSMSPVGAYDMSGNVDEWCHDWYDINYYSVSALNNPTGPSIGTSKLRRGGLYNSIATNSTTWGRASSNPVTGSGAGFRLARYGGVPVKTLTYTAGTGGSVSGNLVQSVVDGNSGSPVTAVPNSGFAFTGWSDGVPTATRTDTNVLANLSVTANFIALPGMIAVAAGSFSMGRTSSGDDATFGGSDELPVHTVTLSAYEIGKFEVTNQQYCDVLNWAKDPSRNLLRTSTNTVWAGTGDIYAGGNLQQILLFSSDDCDIQFSAGSFSPKTRVGLPDSTNYSMGTHPVQLVTWFGAVSFANWLSQLTGLTPVYDANTVGWPANFSNNNYHLPTEAQWERAAAWDGTKHWIYSFTSDILTGNAWATYNNNDPLGLTNNSGSSPVGWFNGVNVSPNGNTATVNSMSPVGAYDMSGNVWEWCHDWYGVNYYGLGPGTDPTGPASGLTRVYRGGGFVNPASWCRSAYRLDAEPSGLNGNLGFRLAK
jgi:formylglycine-generating enzyme required for sulfatase activity